MPGLRAARTRQQAQLYCTLRSQGMGDHRKLSPRWSSEYRATHFYMRGQSYFHKVNAILDFDAQMACPYSCPRSCLTAPTASHKAEIVTWPLVDGPGAWQC